MIATDRIQLFLLFGTLFVAAVAIAGCGGEPPATPSVETTDTQASDAARPLATELTPEFKSSGISREVAASSDADSDNGGTGETESGGSLQTDEDAWEQDARMYAKQFGVDLQEALTRLHLQEPAGKLGAALRANESETFAGLWIQHEPEYRVIVMFTANGEDTIRPYIEGEPLEDIVEVREAEATMTELEQSQMKAAGILNELGFRAASGINVFENRVELYVSEPSQLDAALKEKGMTLPAHVQIISR